MKLGILGAWKGSVRVSQNIREESGFATENISNLEMILVVRGIAE